MRGRWLAGLAIVLTALGSLYLRYRSMGDASKRRRIGPYTPQNEPRAVDGRQPSEGDGCSGGKRSISRRSGGKRENSQEFSAPLVPQPDLPNFLLLMGIPGSGKSTFARRMISDGAPYTIISSDDVRKQLWGDINDQSRNGEVWEVVLRQATAALRARVNVILDATNTNTEKRRRFMNQLPPCNRYLKVFTISKAVARSRIQADVSNGRDRAAVPDAALDKIECEMQISLGAIRDERWISFT